MCNTLVSAALYTITVLAVFGDTNVGHDLPCSFMDSINITDGVKNSDGSVTHNNTRYEQRNFARINYTIAYDQLVETEYYLRGCICQVSRCVWLCCENYTDVEGYPTCTDPKYDQVVVTIVGAASGESSVDLMNYSNVHKSLRIPRDGAGMYKQEEWNIDVVGNVHTTSYSDWELLPDDYCVCLYNNRTVILQELPPSARFLYSIGFMISIPFLLATLVIYGCISELRNIHGKSLMCYVLALTCTYIVLLLELDGVACQVAGYFFYFWSVVSFFWLNVMCFDIFWTFRSGLTIKRESQRFLYYSLYAWVCPVALIASMVIIDNTEIVPDDFRPQMSVDMCQMLGGKLVEFIYFYSILVLLTVANIFFFVTTAIRIAKIQRATKQAFQQGSRRHNEFVKNRSRFGMYLRLFVVMGVSWLFEMISWATGHSDYLFYFTDVINCLQGVIIFVLFVCKAKVRELICKRIRAVPGMKRAKSTSLNTTSTESKSHEKVPLRNLTSRSHT